MMPRPHSLTTLTGHTMAVTSVDWKNVGRGSLIATCSDDRVSSFLYYVALPSDRTYILACVDSSTG